MNKKGFTLVELLAVIVILAVVMLIAVTAVGPMMAKARKNALGTEGIALIKAAIGRFNEEVSKGSNAKFTATTNVCMDLQFLCDNGYFEKGCTDSNDGYYGSVVIIPKNGSYVTRFWITNGTYAYLGVDENNVTDENAIDYDESTMKDLITTCSNNLTVTNVGDASSVTITVPDSLVTSSSDVKTITNNTYNLLKGDINLDGIVDTSDLTLLREYLADYDYSTGTSSVIFSSDQLYAADTNCDGTINLKDVVRFTNYLSNTVDYLC